MKKSFLLASLLLVSCVYGQAPAGYYTSAEGKTGAALKTALYNIIKGHTSISYDKLWNAYSTTDKNSSGKVWDMYSTCTFTFSTDQCGSYANECDCYNREHSFPQSWFKEASPMVSDLFHVYPTDGKVNGARGNYPFGTVGSATYTSANGGSKVGTCNYPGYTGKVFEPINEYKGDFARSYFYMATRYENVIASWESYDSNGDAMLDGTAYPCFEPWALSLLISWHKSDPVSQKEINRNNAVYGIQHNRNPFIDHPEWVECIWSSCATNIIDSENEKNFISVYPNPTSGNVTVSYTLPSASVKEIELFTIDGKLILTKDCADLTENTVNITTSDIPNGIYFIKIITDRSAVTKQLIIQRQ